MFSRKVKFFRGKFPAAHPALTTVRQPFREMGEVAMRKLFNLMKGGRETGTMLKPELIVRGS